MGYGYAVLMGCFGLMIMLAGAIIGAGDYDAIPRNYATNPKDKKAYARAVGKILFMVALAPIASGLFSVVLAWIFGSESGLVVWGALIVLVAGIIIAIRAGIHQDGLASAEAEDQDGL